MGMRPPEWAADGVFITWQTIPWPEDVRISGDALRVVPHEQPPLHPPNADDGWIIRPLRTWDDMLSP